MPPEWHPHESTWLVWPKNEITWPGDRMRQVQESYLEMIRVLTRAERVDLLVDDPQTAAEVGQRIRISGGAAENCRLHVIRTVDSWIRDFGPNFLLRQTNAGAELAFNDWEFNAWGGKYKDLKEDTHIPEKLEPILKVPRFTPDLVLEGGGIDVNGEGVCMSTEQCLLNSNRNPSRSRTEIERCLTDCLGVQRIVWLGEGILGGDTDGHIDEVARFVDPRTVVCARAEDPEDPNHSALEDNYRRLQLARDAGGRRFEILTLPVPRLENETGEPLPATYANFYIANGCVLVPSFGGPEDEQARSVLEKTFPDREMVLIDARAMVWGMGSIHCLTQQQPATT